MLGALFYPKGTPEKPIAFDSLYIPYIYREIYFDGVYIDILNQRKDMVIMDVGANIGIVTQHMLPHAKKIYAIEPSPEHFEALKQNKEYNGWDNVELFNFALSDKDGEINLCQNQKNRTMNSIVVESEVANSKWKIGAQGFNDLVKVQTKAFDTFMMENKIETVDFVKFDVEGAEEIILKSEGFRRIAEKIKSIEIEFHFPNWQELAQYMIDLGFKARRYQCSAVVILFSR